MYARENDVVIVMRDWQESQTHFLFIYLVDSEKAWHYSFESVVISKAELTSLDAEIPDFFFFLIII